MAKAHCITTFFDSATGVALTSATVNVYNPGTVTPISATLFDKSNNPLSNPLTSDATTGIIDFYLTVAQTVDLVVSKSGFSTRTYSNVMVLDDASFDNSAVLTTTGDMLYASANNTPARLPISGTTGNILNVAAGVPAWSSVFQLATSGASAVGIGAAALTTSAVYINASNLTSASQYGIQATPTFTTSATTLGAVFYGVPQLATGSFTQTTTAAFYAQTPVIGASAAVTSAYGLFVADMGQSGTTNAYGIYITAQSGAATLNVGIEIATTSGVALRALGETYLGSPSLANNSTTGYVWIPGVSGTPTGVPAAPDNPGGMNAIRFDTSANKLWVYNGAWKGVALT